MLVLSRKPTECINIGDSIIVTILEIRGNKVPLGIDAPKEVHLLRAELQNALSKPPTRLPSTVAPVA
jgi:carbon storage regulator